MYNKLLNKRGGIKLALALFLLVVLISVGLVYAVSLSDVSGTFFEGFESGNIDNWTTSGAGAAWTALTVDSYAGTYNIYTENTDGESIVEANVSTVGYENITFSFYAYTNGLDNGEYIATDWYDGSSWTNLLSVEDIGSYTLYSYNLNISADNNANLRIRFRCSSGANNEECHVDNIQVSGIDPTPPASVTNLTNQSQSFTWIYWNWTEPGDSDFNQAIVYLDGKHIE